MAGIAVGGSLVGVEVPLMAGRTFGRDMLPPQWVLGVKVVIEGDRFPITR